MIKERGLIIPEEYDAKYSIKETQEAIKFVKDNFERRLAENLSIERVSAPLFVTVASGLNDNLNGTERAVQFDALDIEGDLQIVQSLAKWKRYALRLYGFEKDSGLYTDMNAIRRDEELDNLHSIYVDQWDWEKVISKEERTIETLETTVKKIYKALKDTEELVCNKYSKLTKTLPEEIAFISSEELLQRYPDKTAKEREQLITKEYGAVFITQIGGKLSDGTKHDNRAPDYDDWELNGDILIWFDILDCAVEISSMGIRVDEESMKKQLETAGCLDRTNLEYHKALLNGELPYTIGGGIGQSRLCMLLLERAHIGEIQSSIWPKDMRGKCEEKGVYLL